MLVTRLKMVPSKRPSRPSSQQGAALVLALLVVTIVTLLAVSAGNDFLVTFRRTENQLLSQQAYAQLLAAEGIARGALLADLALGETDSETEQWATAALEYPTAHGMISGNLYDLESRINITNLGQQPTQQLRYSADQLRLIRLLQLLELEESLDQLAAEELANAIFDWVDPDDKERSPGGAENLYYSGLELGLRAPAGGLMASITELGWVKGMTPEIFNALQPFICLWPADGGNININTASLTVLRSLNGDNRLEPMAETDAQLIIDERQSQGALESLDIFNNAALQQYQVNTSGIGYSSAYFLLATETIFMSRRYQLNTIIHRDNTKKEARAIARSQGSL